MMSGLVAGSLVPSPFASWPVLKRGSSESLTSSDEEFGVKKAPKRRRREADEEPQEAPLRVGTTVSVQGLEVISPHLNGLEGVCEQYCSAKGSWTVKLRNGERQDIHADNLISHEVHLARKDSRLGSTDSNPFLKAHQDATSSSCAPCPARQGRPKQGDQAIRNLGEVLCKEGETLAIPRGLLILRAWYGVPAKKWSTTEGLVVTEKVESLLRQGKEVKACNSLFGDPAPWKKKLLAVEVGEAANETLPFVKSRSTLPSVLEKKTILEPISEAQPKMPAKLLNQLKAWADPSCTPWRTSKVAHLADGSCVVLLVTPSPKLFLFEGGRLHDLGISPEWISRGGEHGLLMLVDETFGMLSISRRKEGKPYARMIKRFKFPRKWGEIDDDDDDYDACMDRDGILHIVALSETKQVESEDENLEDDYSLESAPEVWPPPPLKRHLVASHNGRSMEVCEVCHTASMVSISRDGQWCAYRILVGEVQEEANRGEWYACRLAKEAVPFKISAENAVGRVGEARARFSPDGASIVYQANHSEDRPITKHMDLWLVRGFKDGESSIAKLTPGSMQIDAFDWCMDDPDSLWLSGTDGVRLCSHILMIPSKTLEVVEPPPAYQSLPSWHPVTGQAVYAVESATEFEGLYEEKTARTTRLPHNMSRFQDLSVEVIEWDGPGGARVSGALYTSTKCTVAAGGKFKPRLLVWCHGGPTKSWPILRGNFSNSERNQELNFTGLVRAGYQVFVPLYRGTLGFGDEWSMGSIGSQGSRDGDLGDILTGVAHLQRTRGCSMQAGIFGESYGGYLTTKAMADPEGCKMFHSAVSLYGYINNRRMSYETGDYTWEEEFVGDSKQWPAPKRSEDICQDLTNIKAPVLLIHGKEDEVCPLSHSITVHRVLRQQGVPTELVVYPEEGHGFHGEQAMRDCDRRILLWFLKYLPPTSA